MSEIANEAENQETNPDVGSVPAGSRPAVSNPVSIGSSGDVAARQWQGRYDQSQAQVKALEARLQALESSTPAPSITSQDVERAVASTYVKFQGLTQKAADLRGQHPALYEFNKNIFEDLSGYDNVEAFESYVSSEAERLGSVIKSQVAEREKEISDEYAKQYGGKRLREPVDSGSSDSTGGPPSAEEMGRMRMADLIAIDEEYGAGTVEKALARAIPRE